MTCRSEYKPENPAKTFLKRYRAMLMRKESLQRTIDEAYDRATSITQKLKEVTVSGSSPHDKIADEVIKIADSTEQLKKCVKQIDKELAEILKAIESVPDETQKTVLTLRYIEGLDWLTIQERMHYERTQTLVVHGRGLWHVKQWMIKQNYLHE